MLWVVDDSGADLGRLLREECVAGLQGEGAAQGLEVRADDLGEEGLPRCRPDLLGVLPIDPEWPVSSGLVRYAAPFGI
ncbi:hypothetical protein [Catenuloplanes japonicus]|uniref:hypothetical protein n=1 Tax=Catenuloplanes japonicus TaxID=33876 RepID=UPI0012F8B0E9|nr:hypothetical protein [Catenuloplanes japonicus]